MPYLRPDSKAQVTIEYGAYRKPKRIDSIVISTQHDDFDEEKVMLEQIRKDIIEILIPRAIPSEYLDEHTKYYINPTGKFVIGGPHGDTGLTGRKIIVDTYGGKGAHGGGAFSGKDATKVDRSAAYACRHIAKNLVAAGVAGEVLVQVAYAIGISHPVSLNVSTFGTAKVALSDEEIAQKISEVFDMRPRAIIERLGLRYPIFSETAAYGHFGREPFTKEVELFYADVKEDGQYKEEIRRKEIRKIEFFTWEKPDYVEKLQEVFQLKGESAEMLR